MQTDHPSTPIKLVVMVSEIEIYNNPFAMEDGEISHEWLKRKLGLGGFDLRLPIQVQDSLFERYKIYEQIYSGTEKLDWNWVMYIMKHWDQEVNRGK